jgi:DNA polymerase-1
MKKNLLNLLDQVQEGSEIREEKILLVDGLNLFFRNFSAINTLNPNGGHVGGLGGFLNSLGRMISLIKATEVYVFFDGAESTNRKKRVLTNYKKGRGTRKITNKFLYRSGDEEHEAKLEQLGRIIEYLKFLPVKTIIINGIEADDAISYLAQSLTKKCVIVSSDKDFLQVVNDRITVYRPIEKIFYTPDRIKNDYGILPENFIIYKTLVGDKSDNVEGVRGIGPKGVTKLFPELLERVFTIDTLLEVCAEKLHEKPLYSKIILTEEEIRKQHKVMNLLDPLIHESHKENIRSYIDIDPPDLNEDIIAEFAEKDYIYAVIRDVKKWLYNFKQLNSYGKES